MSRHAGAAAAVTLGLVALAAPAAARDAPAVVPLAVDGAIPPLPPSVVASQKAPGKPSPKFLGFASLYRAPDGSTETGLFEMREGAILLRQTADETDHVLKGTLTIHDEASGRTLTFRPGDNFVVPKGSTSIWETEGQVVTLFVLTPALSPAPK
jgi:uncharacterized cupin superfamily protein